MKKYINYKLFGFVTILAVTLTSCLDDDAFTYEVPQQEAVTQVALSVTGGANQCEAVFSVTADNMSSISYIIQPSTDAAPNSSEVFDSGDELSFSSAGSTTLTFDNLNQGTAYTVYAVSVNSDGLRSEEVFTTSYTQPVYAVNVDTDYSASVISFGQNAPAFTATLTPTGTPNEYTIDTAWGPEYVAWVFGNPAYSGQFLYSGTLTINSDLTVTIVGDDPWATGGSGTYNPCNDEISYVLTQALSSNPFLTDVVLTPNNF